MTLWLISIHAPREGSDVSCPSPLLLRTKFQSTLPARGATNTPRTMCKHKKFQSTLPARGATLLLPPLPSSSLISIHAPREGSDERWEKEGIKRGDFNPRSPRGERRIRANSHTLPGFISIHAPREGSDSNTAQIFTIRTAILQHGYQTRLVFGTKSIVLNRKKSFKLPVFLREPTGLFMFTSGSRHGRSKNQRVGHIYGGACTDVLNLSLI